MLLDLHKISVSRFNIMALWYLDSQQVTIRYHSAPCLFIQKYLWIKHILWCVCSIGNVIFISSRVKRKIGRKTSVYMWGTQISGYDSHRLSQTVHTSAYPRQRITFSLKDKQFLHFFMFLFSFLFLFVLFVIFIFFVLSFLLRRLRLLILLIPYQSPSKFAHFHYTHLFWSSNTSTFRRSP